MPRHVAVVFDVDYAEELQRLAFHTPVWIADTPANHAAAEETWHKAIEWPHLSVTLFRPPAGEPSREDWRALIEQISVERALEGLDVIGARLSPTALAALRDFGFARFEETPEGFRAKRA